MQSLYKSFYRRNRIFVSTQNETMARILLVEDDVTFAKTLDGFLKRHGHQTTVISNVKTSSEALKNQRFDLLLLDYRLPDGTGLDVFTSAREAEQTCPAIFMTSFNDVPTAVRAMKMGAFNYITKPVNPDEFLLLVNEALQGKKQPSPMAEPTPKQVKPMQGYVVGKSPAAKKLEEHISLIAPTEMSVIIQGESGTGKEYVARSVHAKSDRSAHRFIAVDCGTLTSNLASSELFGHTKGAFTGALSDKKGVFEAANGGTIFLDEIGNLNYQVQVKLLRALQERTIQRVGDNRDIAVDVRILCATNEDLQARVEDGKFREDLYHRLNEFKILVPPIRMREQDLEVFAQFFMEESNAHLSRNVQRFSPEILRIFKRYDWPGNLRELRNVVRRSVLLTQGEVIEKETLPEDMVTALRQQKSGEVKSGTDLKSIQEETEKELIAKTLSEVKYNKSKAAKLLNIDRKTLYNKMAMYGIE